MAKGIAKKKEKKVEPPPVDGLGPKERKRLSDVIRQVWQRCYARRQCAKRCALPGDYHRCEKCGATVPKIHIDHIEPAGSIYDADFLDRLFCPSSRLQGLCKACHKIKTGDEAAARQEAAKAKETLC